MPRVRTRLGMWTTLLVGLALAITGAALAGLVMAEDPARGRAILAVAATDLAAGREPALSLGLAAGLDWRTAAAVTSTVEVTLLFIGFPFLVLAGDWIREKPWAQRMFAKAEARARRRPNSGVVALGALTLAPFIPVGALTSVLVGEVLRLPRTRLLFGLAIANILANIAFGYATAVAIGLFANPALIAALAAGLLILAAVVGGWLASRREREAPA